MTLDLDRLNNMSAEAFADHELEILRDDGLYRHLRCQKPGTWTYGFDIVTWPGYLAVCGDIGTWVFSRERDMFPWFEASRGINPDYWSEKLQDGHERAFHEEPHDCYEAIERYEADDFEEKVPAWDAQFIYVCHGIVLALKLYRAETSRKDQP